MKKSIGIKPGCTTCGACEFIAPEVFKVTDICHVVPDADLLQHKESIEQAIAVCPVQVIQYED